MYALLDNRTRDSLKVKTEGAGRAVGAKRPGREREMGKGSVRVEYEWRVCFFLPGVSPSLV